MENLKTCFFVRLHKFFQFYQNTLVQVECVHRCGQFVCSLFASNARWNMLHVGLFVKTELHSESVSKRKLGCKTFSTY